MSAWLQSLLLSVSLLAAYIWIQTPFLANYSLQVFALTLGVYFLSKRLSKAKLWHLAPRRESWEMMLATFAFSLLIGSTGNVSSPFFALTFVHLFFLVMATHYMSSLLIAGELVLFHYALSPQTIGSDWQVLVTLPLVLTFFLFGKHQHQEVVKEKHLLQQNEATIASIEGDESSLLSFIQPFLGQKLEAIKELSKYPSANHDAIVGQITLIQVEMQRVLRNLKK